MNNQKFNPWDWLEVPANPPKNYPAEKEPSALVSDEKRSEVLKIIEKIEALKTDIAPAYKDWRNIGFAFADAFGEEGRELFLRISRFYSGYSEKECNEQFDRCLHSNGIGVTLKSFFYLAKNAGIDISSGERYDSEPEEKPMPTFSNSQFSQFPQFLQRVVSVAETPEERDLLLVGAITVISACLPTIYGIYDGRKVYSNLFLFVSAGASAGKGRLVHCKQLVQGIHLSLREEAEGLKNKYKAELAAFNSLKGKNSSGERPTRPPELMLFVPANSSTTGIFQLLSENGGRGLIFETEGDVLSMSFKTDYADYSAAFRQSFHHESISYYRRTDREYVDIQSPKLSAVLSGTPSQIASLIPNSENGLFSRFLFYHLPVKAGWKDVFAQSDQEGLDEFFEGLGKDFQSFYQSLLSQSEIHFKLTPPQEKRFNAFFNQIQKEYLAIKDLDYLATIRRLGLIAFRICMIFSALRIGENGSIGDSLECENRDFDNALAMIRVLVKHSSRVFSELPIEEKPRGRKNLKERFLDELPSSFNRQTFLTIAKRLGVNEKTSDRYIGHFVKNGLLHRDQKDLYLKPDTDNQEEVDQKSEGEETAKIEETAETDIKKEPGPPGEPFP